MSPLLTIPLLQRPVVFWALAALFLAGFTVAGLDLAKSKSATWDEIGHVAAGYSYYANGDYRITTSNVIFSQKFAAWPLRWLDLRFPDKVQQEAYGRDPVLIGRLFLFRLGNDPVRILFVARLMIVVLGVGLGLIVLGWARTLFGHTGALIALLFYVTSPAVVANSSLATTDTAASLFLLLSTWAWWRLLHRFTLFRLLAFGAALGLLILTKYSVLVFGAIGLVLLVVRWFRPTDLVVDLPGGGQRAITGKASMIAWQMGGWFGGGVLAWIIVWAGYDFHYSSPGLTYNWQENEMGPVLHHLVSGLRASRLLPEAYVYDLSGLSALLAPRETFLHGTYRAGGFYSYFPIAFLIKTPLPFLAVLVLAGANLGAVRKDPRAFWGIVPLLVLVGVYGSVSIASRMNLGLRHLLPIYPALCILSGAVGLRPLGALPAGKALLGLVLAWSVVDLAVVHPRELGYFNAMAGGPNEGYRWLADSSTDWGGELPALKGWLDEQQPPANQPSTYLAYLGTAHPRGYGLNVTQIEGYFLPATLFPLTLRGGVYCVSSVVLQRGSPHIFGPWTLEYEREYRRLLAKFAQSPPVIAGGDPALGEKLQLDYLAVSRLCAFLRQREPDAEVAATYLIFRLSDAEVHQALHESPVEFYRTSPVQP